MYGWIYYQIIIDHFYNVFDKLAINQNEMYLY